MTENMNIYASGILVLSFLYSYTYQGISEKGY